MTDHCFLLNSSEVKLYLSNNSLIFSIQNFASMTDSVSTESFFQGETRSSLQAALAMPAHHQLLPTEAVGASPPELVEGLKGYGMSDQDIFFDEFVAEEDRQRGCFHRRTFPWSSGAASPPNHESQATDTEDGGVNWLLGFTSAGTVSPVPGLSRSGSGSSLDTDDSMTSSSMGSRSKPKKTLSFNENVRVVPIPHISEYSYIQKRNMYSNCQEVRDNKIRNKKEFRYDGCDWRNATEEREMPVCALTGELVHPAHTFDF